MSVKRHQVKSCCGRSSIIFETDLPVRKFHVELFKREGYEVPAGFTNAGILYARKNKLVVTGPFNSRRLNVKCYGQNCEEKLKEFEIVLDKIVHTKKL